MREDGAAPVARKLGGRELAAAIRAETAAVAAELAAGERPVTLAAVVATADESAAWYVRSLTAAATKVGVRCQVCDLGDRPEPGRVSQVLRRLNRDPAVHGIVVQSPLPPGMSLRDVAGEIDPAKDVDGANPVSLGRLLCGLPAFAPATAEAVVALLDHHGVALAGRRAVVVGRSTVVGKPTAALLVDRHATVTVCHSRTGDLAGVTAQGDVLVAAAGRPGLITAGHVRRGAVVVDVGVPGDVHGSVDTVAAARSPVPGGVGPVTTAVLLRHTVTAARAQGG